MERGGGALRVAIFHWRDIKSPEHGGAERLLFEIAQGLQSQGAEVAWFSPRFPRCKTHETISGISVRRLGGRINIRLLIPFCYLLFWRRHFDLVVDSITGVPWFTPLYVRTSRMAIIYHLGKRQTFFKDLPAQIGTLGFFLAFVGMVCERSIGYLYRHTAFLTFSDDTRDGLVQLGIPHENISVAQEGIDLSRYSPKFEKTSIPTIIYVGRLVATKGLEHLLQAVAIASSSIPALRLVVVGTGYAEDGLRTFSRRLGIGSIVEFVGYVSEEEKVRLLQDAHVLAMPSLREGWATPVLEANACGTPAVGTDVPGVRETIVHGKTGYLVPYGDADSLASRLLLLLLDSHQRREMGISAFRRVQSYSLESTISVATKMILGSLSET